LDTVIEYAVIFHTAHPAEVSIFQMPLHFLHFHFGMAGPRAPDMVFD
jgi:hypothetical protein